MPTSREMNLENMMIKNFMDNKVKTQVIATIADYAYSIGKSVLLVTPGRRHKMN